MMQNTHWRKELTNFTKITINKNTLCTTMYNTHHSQHLKINTKTISM